MAKLPGKGGGAAVTDRVAAFPGRCIGGSQRSCVRVAEEQSAGDLVRRNRSGCRESPSDCGVPPQGEHSCRTGRVWVIGSHLRQCERLAVGRVGDTDARCAVQVGHRFHSLLRL